MPVPAANVPPAEWTLSEEGRRSCGPLADRLAQRLEGHLARLYASREPKAAETARRVGLRLGLPVELVDGLHEQVRPAQPLLPRLQFDAAVEAVFARPAERVYGLESAGEAHSRFERAVMELVRPAGLEARAEAVVVFAHGTVISLFVSRGCQVDGFSLWKRLGLPSFIVLNINAGDPRFTIDEIAAQISAEDS